MNEPRDTPPMIDDPRFYDKIAHAGTLLMIERIRHVVRRVRLHIGARIMGADWFAVVGALWIIRDRAKAAVTADGRVTLAKCEPLAEVLYAQLPGRWSVSVTLLEEATPDKPDEAPSHGTNATPSSANSNTLSAAPPRADHEDTR